MKHPRILRALLAQSLALYAVACGPQSVRPGDDGGSDAAAPSACTTPRVLFEADTTTATNIAYGRARSGYVEATASRDGTLTARVFDARWQQVGANVDLTSMQPLPATEAKHLTVSFLEDRGAIAYGSSVHELTIDESLSLSHTRTLQAVQAGRAFNLVGAWPRRSPVNTIETSAVATDASEWGANSIELQQIAQSSMIEPLHGDPSVHFVRDSTEFLSFETIYRRDINNDVRVRSFITGHGVLVQSSERTERGTAISPVVRVGDELWRLHYRRNEMAGADDTRLSLVRHDPITGEQRSSTPLTERGLPLSGAVAASSTGATMLVWSREAGASAQPAAIVVQRGDRAPTDIFQSALSMGVLGAWIEEGSERAWVTFVTYTREATPRQTVYVRCVE